MDAVGLVKQLLPTFSELVEPVSQADINGIVKRAFQTNTIPDTSPKEVPHADVTEEVHKFVKHKVTVGNGLSEMFKI